MRICRKQWPMKKTLYVLSFIISLITSCSSDDPLIDISEPEPEPVLKVPLMKTHEFQSLTIYSVKLKGSIIKEGDSDITETGFVAGYTSNPTIETNLNKFVLNADNEGSFEIKLQLTGVEESMEIYIRSYGINSQGVGYGNEIKFTTLENKSFTGQDVVLSTQEEVVAFGENKYNTISRIKITGTVTDLSPLKDLKIINEGVEIINTKNLKNLKGLENLIATGVIFPNGFRVVNNKRLINFEGLDKLEKTRGEFYLSNNENLINLKGLHSFYAVSAGSLTIENCNNLNDLDGLDKLEFIGDGLEIAKNSKLIDISALSKLDFVPRTIYIGENESLTNLNGLESIRNIDFLFLNYNPSLSNIDAIKDCESLNSIKIDGNISLNSFPSFEKIKTINTVQIRYGSEIKNLFGLENLDHIGRLEFFKANIQSLEGIGHTNKIGALEIYDCQKINNLIGFDNVMEIDELYVRYCYNFNSLQGFKLNSIKNLTFAETNMTNLEGLESLKSVKGALVLHFNEKLENTNGLENIEAIQDLWIEGNSKLSHINAFDNLKTLNYLFIHNNKSLKNLKGFSNLETISELGIKNSSLNSLTGLDNLKQINNRIQVSHNSNLNDYCSLSTAFENFSGKFDVYANEYNPTKEDLKNGDCN